VVVDLDLTRRHLVQALVNNAQRLAELLNTAQVPVIAVAILAHRHVKLDLVVCIVRRDLADIPRHTTAAQHHTAKAIVDGLLRRHSANADGTLTPHTVRRHQLLNFVHTASKLRRPCVNVVQQAGRQVVRHTTRTHIRSVHTSTRDTLVKLHDLFTLLQTPHEGRQTTHIHNVREHGHAVVRDTRKLTVQRTDPLGTLRHLDVEQLLHGA